jgi:hypothetical protein
VRDAAGQDEVPFDLIEIATIFSRPEMICFVAALRDHGMPVFVGGDNYGQATLELVAIGGYRVSVPECEVERAADLIAELRLETERVPTAQSLIWGVRALFGVNLGIQALLAALSLQVAGPLIAALSVVFGALSTPVPMTIPGDYRDKRGRMVQMR